MTRLRGYIWSRRSSDSRFSIDNLFTQGVDGYFTHNDCIALDTYCQIPFMFRNRLRRPKGLRKRSVRARIGPQGCVRFLLTRTSSGYVCHMRSLPREHQIAREIYSVAGILYLVPEKQSCRGSGYACAAGNRAQQELRTVH